MQGAQRRLLVALVVAVIGSTAWPVPARAASSQFSAATKQALDQLAASEMDKGDVPGLAIGVWVDGKTYVKAFGSADVETKAPFRANDHVRIASITKTFTGTTVLRLVERGKLSLDDHLSKYVTDIPNGDQITVRELLNMTAGVFDYTKDPAFTTDFDGNPLLPFGPDQVLAIVRRNQPEFAPGTSWSYSDSNYVMLGLIIETVTGQPVGEAITRLAVKPLGLRGTSYPASAAIPNPHPRGYVPDANGGALRDVTELNPAVAGAAGAMISTLPDLRRWARGLATGALLRASTQRERLKPIDTKLSEALDVGYGLGVFEVQGFVGHNGAIYGYNTAAFSLPGRDATIVVVSNNSTNFQGVGLETFVGIAQQLFPKLFTT